MLIGTPAGNGGGVRGGSFPLPLPEDFFLVHVAIAMFLGIIILAVLSEGDRVARTEKDVRTGESHVRRSRLTFEKTFLVVATTWRRLANAFLHRFQYRVSPTGVLVSPLCSRFSWSSSAWTHPEAPGAPTFLFLCNLPSTSPIPQPAIVPVHSTIRFSYGAFPPRPFQWPSHPSTKYSASNELVLSAAVRRDCTGFTRLPFLSGRRRRNRWTLEILRQRPFDIAYRKIFRYFGVGLLNFFFLLFFFGISKVEFEFGILKVGELCEFSLSDVRFLGECLRLFYLCEGMLKLTEVFVLVKVFICCWGSIIEQ